MTTSSSQEPFQMLSPQGIAFDSTRTTSLSILSPHGIILNPTRRHRCRFFGPKGGILNPTRMRSLSTLSPHGIILNPTRRASLSILSPQGVILDPPTASHRSRFFSPQGVICVSRGCEPAVAYASRRPEPASAGDTAIPRTFAGHAQFILGPCPAAGIMLVRDQ
jgi:hypothetical protein